MAQEPQETAVPEDSKAQNSADDQERAYNDRCNRLEWELEQAGLRVHRVDYQKNRQALYLEIGLETTIKSIRDNWRTLEDLRDFMVASRGYWRTNPKMGAYNTINGYKTILGLSWRLVVNRINAEIEGGLRRHLRVETALENPSAIENGKEDFYTHIARGGAPRQFFLFYSAYLLSEFGFERGEIDQWIEKGLERLRTGEPAFEKNQPITLERVRTIWNSQERKKKK